MIAARTLFLLLLCAAPAGAQTPTFQNVVALGDSMLFDPAGDRSPLVSEQLALRLGAPLTRLAEGGVTSSQLLTSGQLAAATAAFGPGDLALLWVGSNDTLPQFSQIAAGNFAFLDVLEDNTDIALGALRAAGMDVLVFNLPDFTFLPRVQLTVAPADHPMFTAFALEWRNRLDALAASHGAVVVDAFGYSQAYMSNPAAFAVGGVLPIGAPSYGSKLSCPYCLFFDPVHPSALGQGFYSNRAIGDFNAFFDPNGLDPLPQLTDGELRTLASNLPAAYCTAKPSSPGCQPAIAFQGSASLTGATAFDITASGVVNNKPGLLFYGFGSTAVPFLGGTLCVAPPLRRLGIQVSGGNSPPDDCSGTFTYDFSQYLASGQDTLTALGDVLYAQYWFRDPADATGFGVGLTDGLAFAVLP